MDNTIKLELDSTHLAEFVAIVKDLANTVGMHGDLLSHHTKVLEDHDGALVKDAQRIDDLTEEEYGSHARVDGLSQRIRKLEWGGDKTPAPDAVKVLAKRLDVLDQTVSKTMIALSDRLRVVEHPEDHSVRQCGGLCGEPAPTVCGEEPKSVGAVVRDAEGGLWVRADHGKGRPWREVLPGTYDEDDACRRKWGQFTATDVLSFGVDAGSREAAAGFTSAVPGVVHDNLVSQLAIAIGRLDEEDAMGYETVPEFLAGARWLLAVARNARP